MQEATLTPTRVGMSGRIVLEGDSQAERRGSRQPVATSQCEYRFHTEASLHACLAALTASDAALAANPDRLYDWNRTEIWTAPDEPGGIIRFSVSWYDAVYFDTNREIFAGGMHQHLYDQMGGIGPEDITVTHWRAA